MGTKLAYFKQTPSNQSLVNLTKDTCNFSEYWREDMKLLLITGSRKDVVTAKLELLLPPELLFLFAFDCCSG